MNEIIQILVEYSGTGMLLLLYAASVGYLVWKERTPGKRMLLIVLPILILFVFLIPPVYELYSSLDGSETYYRLLWMIPMTLTIAYAGVLLFSENLSTGVLVMCCLIVLCGEYIYDNENILDAENRLHIPQMVLDVSDFLMNETGGERTIAAMPSALVQYVRQYNAMIVMPFGREMLMGDYYNPVYEAMEETDPVEAKALCEALEQYDCEYLVIETVKVLAMEGSLEDYDLTFLSDVDGYSIYHCPYWDEAQEETEALMQQ